MAFPKIDGYVVTEKLGSGSYSTVYKAYTKVGARTIVAIKCVDKCRVKNSGSAVDNLITEIRLLKTLQHPHIVRMHHFTWDERNIYIIMEYCCGGDLSKYIHRYGRVPEKQVLYFLQQLASALKFLSEKGVVHMDLKPHNLLLHKESDGKYILKVADFGFAQHLSCDGVGLGSGVRGSPLYMAPEMIAGDYDARVDLWSVGVIMYECLFGKAPYSSSTFKELVDKIQKQAPIEIPRNSSISPACCDLLTRLLQHDPDTRITYHDFFNHEYLDLEHMPSKENYEKAVSLIKQAVELDAAGRASPALRCYTLSLRYLVPAAATERDALRRSALTAKLTRYMERAEEIKAYLKYSRTESQPESPTPSDTRRDTGRDTGPATGRDSTPATRRRRHDMAPCCGNTTAARDNTNSYDFSNTRLACNPCKCSSRPDASWSCATHPDGDGDTNGDTEMMKDPTVESSPQGPQSRGAARSAFKRLFSRQNLPYLDTKDSSITDDTAQTEKAQKTGEANDACRIT